MINRAFIGEHTERFGTPSPRGSRSTGRRPPEISGLTRAPIEKFAADVIAADSVIVCWAMGLTQHQNAVETSREVMNFLLLRATSAARARGRAGARAQQRAGRPDDGRWEKMPDAFLAGRRRVRVRPPRAHGLDVVDSIRAMRDGKAEVFFGLGGNFAAAAPDSEVTAAALARCALTVHVSTKLNRSHLLTGREALILPCLGRTERDGRRAAPST